MTDNTRILHRFTGYTVADCDCIYCLHYGGNKIGCMLDSCCCEEERKEAMTKQRKEFVNGSKN